MASKKFINSIDTVVQETLSGLCTAYPQLNYHPNNKVVLSHDWNTKDWNKVSIVCGGGSGHEPFAAGFVGTGMLSASIAGYVFAAPPSNHILHALKCVTQEAGTLVVIPNYTGDCLNFGIAIEKAKQEELKIAEIVISDDCSIPAAELGRAGKRGLVGMLFVIKISGALSQRSKSLDEILYHAKIISNNIATYGVGLNACSLPGQGPMVKLPEDEIEVGFGVHGEAGYSRMKITEARIIVSVMLNSIIESLSLRNDDFVAVIINNFGGTSQLEQGIVVHEVVLQLNNAGVNVVRIYSGTLMTSLNAAGIHISVLKLPKEYKDLYIQCLDDPTDAPCWPGCSYSLPPRLQENYTEQSPPVIPKLGRSLENKEARTLRECLINACTAIINNEEKLNDLDRGCGDGDCGSTHRKWANGILSSLENLQTCYPTSLLMELSQIAEEHMGGTSGAIYSLIFTATASALLDGDPQDNWMRLLAKAWRRGLFGVMKYSKAQPGDRTMVDALEPAWKAFNDNLRRTWKEAVKLSAEAAKKGCEATKEMIPRAGRASYVKNAEFFNNVDAGAYGVSIWLTAISETLSKIEVTK